MRTEIRRMMLHSAETIVNYSFEGKVCQFTAKSGFARRFPNYIGLQTWVQNEQKLKQTRSLCRSRGGVLSLAV